MGYHPQMNVIKGENEDYVIDSQDILIHGKTILIVY